ncbi:hypothetical protein IL306_004882 [Fusarium sp. DS 682]|nr:hypothetical protein IL306_004882 [Fusarium sp. DS 682]
MHRYTVQKIGDEVHYVRIFEEWEDSDYDDQSEEPPKPINQEIAQLIAWIDDSEDPIPSLEEVHAKYQELFGKLLANNRSHRSDIERFWTDRLLNGTALKVLNPDVVSKWKQESLQMPWASYQHNGEFTSKMADMCFKDLITKAGIYQETNLIPIIESSACVIKSDRLLTTELTEKLKAAAAQLEDVPENQRDWHPGSDDKVLDLVHPSLWPLVFGQSRILPDKYVTIDKCLDYCGAGEIIPEPYRPHLRQPDGFRSFAEDADKKALSLRYQWLPCDVDLTGDRPRIKSYINNLHPVQNTSIYSLIEEIIEKSLPAWDIVCRSARKEFKF